MGKRFIWAVAFAVVLAGCTDDTGEMSTTSTTESATTTTTPAEPTDRGRLAVIDSGGDIVVMDPDGSNREAVTENAGTDNPALYMQPVWSPDASTLAWGQTTGTGFGVGISRPGSDLRVTLTTPNLPFYTHWSPDGRYLGVLHNGPSGVQFQIADIEEESTSLLDEDAPFYFSWSPDSDRVVTHAGATRAETISPDGERIALEPTTANYLAPQWTDNGVFHVVDDELVLEDDDGERRPVATIAGLTMFVANRHGSHVALQTTGDDGSGITASTEEFPTVTTDAVVVVDVETGETEVVDNALALGFFWSPDGESLLVLSVTGSEVVPTVWTLGGEEIEFANYQPNVAMAQSTFPFFPQYAQSVSFWSPDSTAFAFAGDVDDETGVWVQELTRDTPTRVSDGVWVAWSPPRG